MGDFYQLSATGQLHRMEAGHAGAGASSPIPARLVSLDRYELCNLPSCFGHKDRSVGGALAEAEAKPAEDAEEAEKTPRRRRLSHGVRAEE